MGDRLECVVDKLKNGVGVARLVGRFDIASAAEVKRVFGDVVSGGAPRLVVDLSGVGFIDSSGLSALVSGLRTARQAGGDLRIAAAGDQPSALFTLTSLDQVFKLYPTVQEAMSGYDD